MPAGRQHQSNLTSHENSATRTIERAPWAKPDAGPLGSNLLNHCVDDFKREPGSVLDGAAILVSPLIADVLQELVDEVSIRAMDLDSIESCTMHRVMGSVRIILHIFLDFYGVCMRSVAEINEM